MPCKTLNSNALISNESYQVQQTTQQVAETSTDAACDAAHKRVDIYEKAGDEAPTRQPQSSTGHSVDIYEKAGDEVPVRQLQFQPGHTGDIYEKAEDEAPARQPHLDWSQQRSECLQSTSTKHLHPRGHRNLIGFGLELGLWLRLSLWLRFTVPIGLVLLDTPPSCICRALLF